MKTNFIHHFYHEKPTQGFGWGEENLTYSRAYQYDTVHSVTQHLVPSFLLDKSTLLERLLNPPAVLMSRKELEEGGEQEEGGKKKGRKEERMEEGRGDEERNEGRRNVKRNNRKEQREERKKG